MNIITRSDFDGLVGAMLLKQVEIVDQVRFAHPRDVQQDEYEVTPADIIVNLPYHPKCAMWFDHHSSERARPDLPQNYEGRCEIAPSCARVIVNHYGSKRFAQYADLLDAVDRVDSANLTVFDVADPQKWVLLGFLMDPRTGLGKYHDYAISNRQLMYALVDKMATHSADEILSMYDVRQRVERYKEQQEAFKAMLEENSRIEGNLIVTDLRGKKDLPTGNRFLIYTLFQNANISMLIQDGRGGQNVAVAIGHSIFNRNSRTDVGKLCADYGSGGHRGAGTIQFTNEEADAKITEIIGRIRQDG
ncbi:MAG: hypothetical protein PWP23_2154 [Candidatus Sumerlaeota bacterium]|nr:hypothetical protein [Candidatus Sumerlaeota bacterium]